LSTAAEFKAAFGFLANQTMTLVDPAIASRRSGPGFETFTADGQTSAFARYRTDHST
jgi:hypothetical protein